MLQGISTAIWLDRIAAIQGGAANSGRLGLTQHFDAAVKQAAAAKKPVVVQIVVYDLPSRCFADATLIETMGQSRILCMWWPASFGHSCRCVRHEAKRPHANKQWIVPTPTFM